MEGARVGEGVAVGGLRVGVMDGREVLLGATAGDSTVVGAAAVSAAGVACGATGARPHADISITSASKQLRYRIEEFFIARSIFSL